MSDDRLPSPFAEPNTASEERAEAPDAVRPPSFAGPTKTGDAERSQLPIFYVNLDRSAERRTAIEKSAEAAGLGLTRVAALTGADAPDLCDEPAFVRCHGKRPLPGEIGCYASHLKALRTFLKTSAETAVIVEDDVEFDPAFDAVTRDLAGLDHWDVVKLCHHRLRFFTPVLQFDSGHRLGAGGFGPTGSLAAYMVTRSAAETLVRSLDPMRLPVDISLERAWEHGLTLFSLKPDLVRTHLEKVPSTIVGEAAGAKGGYSKQRLAKKKRLTTARFRTAEFFRRLFYWLGASVWPIPEPRERSDG